ncbi:ATP-grasp domain-containing protein [Massilia dura]|uniref:ATP-grasp domain-containing protein n=1 Tax=Pseudoduganella dura TaxID=321982 RepID=A0A6I3XH94_9BURK|nr:ATP-grasp domain-containing protein [Pseudoduganella dura]MUI13021.1 ATP-grasp domain-containing protein [Pseudoduganella dura]GGX87833.1 hypothetical protein GCM10007386_18350 [Pseudoduganella dura]
MRSVLILGGRAPVALDHARRFAAQGWRVVVADSVSCRLAGWSRAVAATVRLAPPRHAPAAFVAGLNAAIARERIDMVVPTCEEVFFLSRYRSALPAGCRIVADDFDKLRLLHSKWEFARLAGSHAPATALVDSVEQARDWAAGRPLVLKPEFSRFGVHVRLHPRGMPATAAPLPALGAWVAQAYCEGTELCSYSVATRGRLTAHALYRPVHRLHRSSSYYFAPHACEPIRQFVAALVARLDFTGQISFDWIDTGDGHPRVLECNPRATSGLHLFSEQDAVPAALDGTHPACVTPQGAQARMLAPVMVSAGFAQALAGGRAGQWLRDARGARDVITAPGDRAPAAGALLDMAWFARTAWRQRCTLREAATSDIEWDGEDLAWA